MKTYEKILILVILFLLCATQVSLAATYEYDYLHRLTKVTYDDGTSIFYSYDASGNRSTLIVTYDDSDGDGIINPQETIWGLNPDNNDTDIDGLTDYEEVNYDGDPNSYDPMTRLAKQGLIAMPHQPTAI
jgi:YD repeat-containing protein